MQKIYNKIILILACVPHIAFGNVPFGMIDMQLINASNPQLLTPAAIQIVQAAPLHADLLPDDLLDSEKGTKEFG